MPQNHVIDPLYFKEALDEFAFNYTWYSEGEFVLDDMGRKVTKFDAKTIYGSLQSQGTALQQKIEGNTEQMKYKFYCMSNYRIKIGDFIVYKNRFLHVDNVEDYDEWGVRNCALTMTNLTNLKDLEESNRYLSGESVI